MRPPVLAPMLPSAVPPPRDLSGYQVEPKWDGVRLIITVHEGAVSMVTRNGREVCSHYPELAALAAAVDGRSVVLDGEVVTFDEKGRTSFQRLQQRMHVARPSPDLLADVPVRAMFFDVLWIDGELLTGLPLRERRARLEQLRLDGPSWHLTPLLPTTPVDELLRACDEVGMEGYVLKRTDAAYLPGRRSSAWIKLKCIQRRELVVGGWTRGEGGRSGSIGALVVGLYGLDRETGGSDGTLRYVGKAGSGLTQDWIRQLTTVAERLATDENPFSERLIGVHFLEPLLIAEVAYSQVTAGGTLRHPTLQGFRTDLDPADIVADGELQDAFDQRPPGMRIRV
ncbi:MAG: non-homologous end-joining DNA ligase [Acidimicrobiales bacterium]